MLWDYCRFHCHTTTGGQQRSRLTKLILVRAQMLFIGKRPSSSPTNRIWFYLNLTEMMVAYAWITAEAVTLYWSRTCSTKLLVNCRLNRENMMSELCYWSLLCNVCPGLQSSGHMLHNTAILTSMTGVSGESLLRESGSLQVNLIVRRPLATHRNSTLPHPPADVIIVTGTKKEIK